MHIKNIVNKCNVLCFIPLFYDTDKNTIWILKEAVEFIGKLEYSHL